MTLVQMWTASLIGSLLFVGGGCVDQREIQPPEEGLRPEIGMDPPAATDRVGERDVYVALEAVRATRSDLRDVKRNPFLFGSDSWSETVEIPGGGEITSKPSAVITSAGSIEDALPLRFIGIVEAPKTVGRIAVLTDGRVVFQGAKGDILEGRYRITDISGDRVEIEILPGGKREVLYREGV